MSVNKETIQSDKKERNIMSEMPLSFKGRLVVLMTTVVCRYAMLQVAITANSAFTASLRTPDFMLSGCKKFEGQDFRSPNIQKVCSRHFENVQIRTTAKGRGVLASSAVPSLFEWNNNFACSKMRPGVWERRTRPVLSQPEPCSFPLACVVLPFLAHILAFSQFVGLLLLFSLKLMF